MSRRPALLLPPDVALVLLVSQHPEMPETLDSLFGGDDLHLTAMARIELLEGQLEIVERCAEAMSRSISGITAVLG